MNRTDLSRDEHACNDVYGDPESPIGMMLKQIVQAHVAGIDAGFDLQQKKLDAILAVYDACKGDPQARIPTRLMAVLEGLRK